MSSSIDYLPIFFLLPLLAIPLASGFENTEIIVSVIGKSVINLDDSERLVRAYIEVINFDPSDGIYTMKIIHSSTGEIISEQDILVREKGNDKAGVDVAYLLNEDELYTNGTAIMGDYEILVTTKAGNLFGKTTFSIIKPSNANLSIKQDNSENNTPLTEEDESDSNSEIQLTESVVLDPTPQIDKEESFELQTDPITNQELRIPEWIRTIFILYAEGSISDTELLNAIEFLIGQEIIRV